MSGNADTIKDFLVSLGFDIDQAGANKFEAVLKGVTANVLKVGAVVEGAALSIVGFTTQIANGLDKIYWASQRTGASVQGIKALGYAASQTGSSAEAAQNSLESLARFMRSNPGAEGFLNRLGVQTRDASGQMRDMSAIFTGVGQRLSSMPYYRANQYAQMLGIDENTLMAMRRGLSGFSTEYQSMMQKTGFNADKAAIQSNKFMTSMRSFVSLLGILRDKVGSNLADGLSGTLDNLSKRMLENWPKIEEVVTKVVKGVLWAADAIGRVAWRITQAVDSLIVWFRKLSPAVQELIGLFAVLISGWRLLNTEFLKSPIGIVLALFAAIFALIEDYKTWKEGGKSLIAWDKWEPEINAAIKSLGELRDSVAAIGTEIARLLNIDLKNWTLKGDIDNLTKQFGEFGKMIKMIGELLRAIDDGRWSDAVSVGKQLLNQGKEQPTAIPAVVDSANRTAELLKEKTGFDPRSIGRWFRRLGEPEKPVPNAERRDGSEVSDRPGWLRWLPATGKSGDEPEQHAQSVKRPEALEHAGTIAELVNNYARKSDQASNQYLISTLSREMGIAVDSKLLPSDMRDLLKVLRGIAQNINQPGSESATEIISSPQVINAEQFMRTQASAQVPDYVDTIAKLVNNYAKNSGRADNRALIAELTRITGKSDDSKLLSSDMQDILKVLRDIAQNINQPGSESAAELLLPRPVIANEQPTQRPQASAQGKVLLNWMQPMFSKLESLYRLPEGLLKSVAITESGGNQFAMSGAGAKGLFQFMDGTARDMGLRGNDVFDPEKSAQAAAKYLSQLLRQNGGDLSKALASYNWGIGNVKRYGMGLMPQETRNYIPKVMSNMPTSAPVIQQETNINIHGVSDPREAARLTVDRQKGVNSQLTQQLPAGPR
ncbi:transglycosylase SLT domain-containing protein [Enterobacter chengduensis]|uniref:transglycosylase SLT domain-containing protein n=1 Tax=Enterobacter chengduensis TaxID=2494701 RepID=UPI002002CFAB|nr:transglycosylase SLT domain-containing protein [Enterobacter chengduensis]MCK7427808.1 transglycosylase SLT domain-containing protein [Enterobacter chengduensis]